MFDQLYEIRIRAFPKAYIITPCSQDQAKNSNCKTRIQLCTKEGGPDDECRFYTHTFLPQTDYMCRNCTTSENAPGTTTADGLLALLMGIAFLAMTGLLPF